MMVKKHKNDDDKKLKYIIQKLKHHFKGGQQGQEIIQTVLQNVDKNDPKNQTIETFLEYLYEKGKNENQTRPIKFRTRPLLRRFYLYYLITKFSSNCSNIGISLFFDMRPSIFNSMMTSNLLNFNENAKEFVEDFLKCRNNKNDNLIIIPVIISMKDLNGVENYHANVVVCRKTDKNSYTFEHFEPHGNFFANSEMMGESITNYIESYLYWLKRRLDIKYQLVKSNQVCPNIKGLQSYEKEYVGETGGCLTWSTLFLEMCLRNPDLSGNEVLKRLLDYFEKNKEKIKFITKGLIDKMLGKVDKFFKEIITDKIQDKYQIEEIFENDYSDFPVIEELAKILMAIINDDSANANYQYVSQVKQLLNESANKQKNRTAMSKVETEENENQTKKDEEVGKIRFTPENNDALRTAVSEYKFMTPDQKKYYWKHWNKGYFNDWDVSKIESMPGLFSDLKTFNEPIDKWDVSNVTNMNYMFKNCEKFNQPLNNWDVSKVALAYIMFENCKEFNQPLNKWKVNNFEIMDRMFYGCLNFNQDLSNWNLDKVYKSRIDNVFTNSGMAVENMPLRIRPIFISEQENNKQTGGKKRIKKRMMTRKQKTKKRTIKKRTLKNRPTI